MTLGCGSHGGNITSDNIGPQHLMNIKRVAWESRAVEHRTIPADQRLAGYVTAGLAAAGRDRGSNIGAMERQFRVPEAAAPSTEIATATPRRASAEAIPDRQTIARIVEEVFAARGISRGGAAQPYPTSGKAAASASEPTTTPAPSPEPARAGPKVPQGLAGAGTAAAPAPARAAEIEVAEFVCETDVRAALARNAKIFIGPKTIVTPSARDLGNEHDLFIRTELIPSPKRKRVE